MEGEKRLLEPTNREELLRGWLLHAHKGRDRHDIAARRCEWMRYVIGVPAVALPAIVGTSIFASIDRSADTRAVLAVGLVSILAAVLTALQTFLDYPGRAASHHVAAAKYKASIHELEQMLVGHLDPKVVTDELISDLRVRLDALEETSPVVGGREWDRVERMYVGAQFVGHAIELTTSRR